MQMPEVANAISTGSLSLDLALGGQGLPRGAITELYGAPSSGKSSVALLAIAQVQRNGGTAAYLDAEHAFDPTYARGLGVDLSTLVLAQPAHAEEALGIARHLAYCCVVDLLVLDSIAALAVPEELDSRLAFSSPGVQPRVLAAFLAPFAARIAASPCAVLLVNQLRSRLNVSVGGAETSAGGDAVRIHAQVRAQLYGLGSLENAEEGTGSRIRAIIRKNWHAQSTGKAEFTVIPNRGYALEEDIITAAGQLGILRRQAAGCFWNGERIADSLDDLIVRMKRFPNFRERLRTEVQGPLRQRHAAAAARASAAFAPPDRAPILAGYP